jgi:hypothetical protein
LAAQDSAGVPGMLWGEGGGLRCNPKAANDGTSASGGHP